MTGLNIGIQANVLGMCQSKVISKDLNETLLASRKNICERKSIYDLFLGEEGYTAEAFTLAILVSLVLVFSAAAAQWTLSRSADIQSVADACALSGANTTGAYTTVVQIVDALLLSLGLCATIIAGIGFVVLVIPGAQAEGLHIVELSVKILEGRSKFAKTALSGLQKFEQVLPFVIGLSGFRVVDANNRDNISYTGVAIPFPLESKSVFSAPEDIADGNDVLNTAKDMKGLTDKLEAALKRRQAAKEEGWLADCGGNTCCRERAVSLAGLSIGYEYYPLDIWNFGVSITRTRAYYRTRLGIEQPINNKPIEITRSKCRTYFYEYALRELQNAYYIEDAQGYVDMSFPKLARNTSEIKETSLYTDRHWFYEIQHNTIHSYATCPGISSSTRMISLSEADALSHATCHHCELDAVAQGKVASATTNTPSGYEHWYRKVQEASERYQQADQEIKQIEEALRAQSDHVGDVIDKALSLLAGKRPKICPPGAFGCIGVVMRPSGVAVPAELTRSFLESSHLDAELAISGAVLAPVEGETKEGIIRDFFGGLADHVGAGDATRMIVGVWEDALSTYGKGVAELNSSFDKAQDFGMGTWSARYLKGKLNSLLEMLDLHPADLRIYKPVLVDTSKILNAAGYTKQAKLREWIARLPQTKNPHEFMEGLIGEAVQEIDVKKIILGTLDIPLLEQPIDLAFELFGGAHD